MQNSESAVSKAITEFTQHPEQTYRFTKWLAVIGFVAGGGYAFYCGYRAFSPPPAPPGTFVCGNAVLGGLFLMIIGSPIIAVTMSAFGALTGATIDFFYANRLQFGLRTLFIVTTLFTVALGVISAVFR